MNNNLTKEEQIEIPFSKTKMTLTFLGSVMFVGLGLWFLIKPPKSNHLILGNPTLIFITGLAAVIFFGFVAVTIFRKFLDKNPGLILSKQGITDNSSGVSVGLIPWTDIQEVKITQEVNQRFIMLIVRNPQYNPVPWADRTASGPSCRVVTSSIRNGPVIRLSISAHSRRSGWIRK